MKTALIIGDGIVNDGMVAFELATQLEGIVTKDFEPNPTISLSNFKKRIEGKSVVFATSSLGLKSGAQYKYIMATERLQIPYVVYKPLPIAEDFGKVKDLLPFIGCTAAMGLGKEAAQVIQSGQPWVKILTNSGMDKSDITYVDVMKELHRIRQWLTLVANLVMSKEPDFQAVGINDFTYTEYSKSEIERVWDHPNFRLVIEITGPEHSKMVKYRDFKGMYFISKDYRYTFQASFESTRGIADVDDNKSILWGRDDLRIEHPLPTARSIAKTMIDDVSWLLEKK